MTNNNVKDLLNKQFSKEMYSAYLYLAIAGYYNEKNLDGFSNWFEVQAQEELDHAMLFRKYLQNDGFPVTYSLIEQPETVFLDIKMPLIATLAHEQMITSSIHDIYSQAFDGKDFKTTQFLDWFIKEQGEEEKNSTDLINKFDLYGQDSKGLYMLNAELLTRIHSLPSLTL